MGKSGIRHHEQPSRHGANWYNIDMELKSESSTSSIIDDAKTFNLARSKLAMRQKDGSIADFAQLTPWFA